MMAVKAAAKAAGAYGCTISGAGPTAVAICDNPDVAQKVGKWGGGESGWRLRLYHQRGGEDRNC